MVLAEVLIEMNNLRQKIRQLEDYLHRTAGQDATLADKATSKLLDLLDKHRSHLILLNDINNSVEVSIGGSKVSLANAILITKTMKRKVDLLNSLIEGDSVLDVFSLMEQRDKLYMEYTTISNGLTAIEWSTNVDQKSMG
jgi:hypothetical protein